MIILMSGLGNVSQYNVQILRDFLKKSYLLEKEGHKSPPLPSSFVGTLSTLGPPPR